MAKLKTVAWQLARRLLGSRRLAVLELRNKLVYGHTAVAVRRTENAEVRRLSGELGPVAHAKVAVIIATYRRPELLIKAVQSVLAQTERDLSVLVVDDGGGLPELPTDPRLRACALSRNTANVGLVNNVGIRLTNSTYVTFLADDNEFEPEHIAAMLAAFDSAPGERPDAVYPALQRRFPDGRLLDVFATPFDRRLLLREGYIDGNGLTIRRFRNLHISRIRRPRGISPREDWELVYRLSRRKLVRHVPVPTVIYQVNPDSYWTDWSELALAEPQPS
jgi:glycosyltransferase involved in cell wall biosynthesis